MSETSQARSRAQDATGTEHVPPQTRGRMEEDYRPSAREESLSPYAREDRGGGMGGIAFASTLLFLAGAYQVIVGLTALLNNDFYVVTSSGLVVDVNYTAWGWVHLALGVVAVAAALGLMTGQTWARVTGIAMAAVSAIINLAFIPAYPLWALVVIALDIVVIYAIAVHGSSRAAT
ncbi:hypothetical protein [Saccharomonospora sp. NB11]|jgi:hypothetical protein|uniref:DUF7144 family membrane protein n=1 Tax=Saccharomonospora sp. NB11 TaxID=1642298 RepID=UPI0018D1C4A8|nr:hypothetical protein [Saccharomonospora sp. NB11]